MTRNLPTAGDLVPVACSHLLGVGGIKEEGAMKFEENALGHFCERKADIVKHRIRGWGGGFREGRDQGGTEVRGQSPGGKTAAGSE